uniref:PIG-L family deacetylase n=2 Tax=Paracidobacterium acidisoli TaxID=2303751 RepID=A0A372IJQ6_9BACT
MCVTAHPDDESGAFGGALLTAHQQGVETGVLCLTNGEAAHFRGEVAAGEDLGKVRRAELEAAAAVLAIAHHEVLHYPDGELPRQDFYELAGAIAARIRRWRPHVVLTFGGDGSVNLHRDHTMVSVTATAAFHWAGRPEFFPEQLAEGLETYAPQKLYYSSTPFISVRGRPELSGSSTMPYSLTLELNPELSARKLEAFRQHSSQSGVLERVGEHVRNAMARERFLLVATRGIVPVSEDRALFAGITGD